jgi:hypothetical protein
MRSGHIWTSTGEGAARARVGEFYLEVAQVGGLARFLVRGAASSRTNDPGPILASGTRDTTSQAIEAADVVVRRIGANAQRSREELVG